MIIIGRFGLWPKRYYLNPILGRTIMCRRLIYLVSLVFVLSIAANASADLILHWPFDDGSGTTAYDTSGNGRNGTIVGDPKWVTGMIGGALDFGGDGDHVISTAAGSAVNGLSTLTVALWIKSDVIGTDSGFIIFEDPQGRDTRNIRYDQDMGGGLLNGIKYGACVNPGDTDDDEDESPPDVQTTEWQHIAVTWQSGVGAFPAGVNLYIDGVLQTPSTDEPSAEGVLTDYDRVIVGKGGKDANGGWDGLIDDVRIYNEVMSAEQIQGIMLGEGYPFAIGPDPGDGALHADTWASISWRAGDYAVSHDVYFGDNFDDVNNGTGDAFRGNQDSEFFVVGFPGYPYPDGLIPGTTYYWRIDEVNDAEPNSPWKGDVWSFSIPPKIAYTPEPVDGAELVDLDVKLSWTAGFGAKLHYVYFGEDFDEVNDATMGIPQGTTTYTPGTLKLAKTYYWRIDEFDADATHKGEVWSFTTEGAVSGPNPANGAVDVSPTQILTWDAGAVAASHEVYFGSDADTVKNATKSSPEYKGVKALGEESYDPGILTLNTAHYWRIDEVNGASTDSPWAGNVWSFTTGNFFVIDDFEDYDAGDNQIWFAWHDGLGAGVPGVDPYVPGNGTGSAVGDETTASYTEETIIHGGLQAMPLVFDNNKQGFSKYSEVELILSAVRDWTAEGVAELSIWFRGNPASVGSFVEGPVGTFTMTASGADIWNDADEFHYAFKTLTGPGSIIARVESVEQTDNWAKAGVMIRETLAAGSKFAAVYITSTNADGTATNGCRFQARSDADASATSDSSVATAEQTAIVAPYWVKLQRDVAGNFTGYYSADGSSWRSMFWNPQSISMSSNVYIGLALTSHNAGATCEAKFSNVTITGTAGQQWASQDVGIESNAAEPLYVAVSNSAGAPAVVVNDDPAAANIATWIEWVVPLQAFADQGINLTNVNRIAIGLGTQGNMTIPGGSGKMYFDDIRLYQPTEAAE